MTAEALNAVEHALATVRQKLEKALKQVGRAADSATLVAVSKNFDAEAVRPALRAGQRIFGENRVQEAATKWPVLRAAFPNVELHLIGPLQSNKAEDAVKLFDAIETLDRPKLAHVLADLRDKGAALPQLYVQVNTGDEEQKAGIAVKELPDFLKLCVELKLDIVGLMCIPPVDDHPAPHFALLERLAQRHGIEKLSMGMSADYDVAVGYGATHVRVGSAIFGNRYTA